MINDGLSFIIPTLNEEEHIGGVLDSIKENLDGIFKYEVLVVDNGSSDKTVKIAMEKGAICLQVPGCSISSLRNLGALKAKCDIFVFLDGDVYLDRSWGEKIGPVMEMLHSQSHIITGSLYGISDENNWIERIWFAPRTTLENVKYINGGHLIIHRNQFLNVKGFDPDLKTGEDYEFCVRAKKMGASIENNPELKVVHAGYPKTIKHFFFRERWHGSGDCKSFKTLLSSKPSLVSIANLFSLVVCSFSAAIYSQLWLTFLIIYVFFLVGCALAASVKRCCGTFNNDFMGIVFLYMIYFTARSMSLVDAVICFFTEKNLAIQQ